MRAAFVGLFCFVTGIAQADEPLRVYAASSLVTVLPKIATEWKKATGVEVEFQFDASSRLAEQLREGAKADLFLTADEGWISSLEGVGVVEPLSSLSPARIFGNRLVVAVPKGVKSIPTRLSQLDYARFRRIAVGAENVPVGKFARQALLHSGHLDALRDRFVNAQSAREALEVVARGEVDAAILYATDALSEPRALVAFEIEKSLYDRIDYRPAIVKGSPNRFNANGFILFLNSEQARRILLDAGFSTYPLTVP